MRDAKASARTKGIAYALVKRKVQGCRDRFREGRLDKFLSVAAGMGANPERLLKTLGEGTAISDKRLGLLAEGMGFKLEPCSFVSLVADVWPMPKKERPLFLQLLNGVQEGDGIALLMVHDKLSELGIDSSWMEVATLGCWPIVNRKPIRGADAAWAKGPGAAFAGSQREDWEIPRRYLPPSAWEALRAYFATDKAAKNRSMPWTTVTLEEVKASPISHMEMRGGRLCALAILALAFDHQAGRASARSSAAKKLVQASVCYMQTDHAWNDFTVWDSAPW